jgi:uncharacterized membrane protein (Fun14 family)
MSKIREWVIGGLKEMGAELVGPGAPWRAKSVWAAALAAILGTGFWQRGAPALKPDQPAQEQAGSRVQGQGGGEAQPAQQPSGPASSAAVALGVSYVGGYFLGWCYRRFVKLSVVLTGAALAALAAVKSLGLFETDVAALEGHVREGSAWLSSHAESLNNYLTGLLPSAGATGLGAFGGFRRKRRTAPAAGE